MNKFGCLCFTGPSFAKKKGSKLKKKWYEKIWPRLFQSSEVRFFSKKKLGRGTRWRNTLPETHMTSPLSPMDGWVEDFLVAFWDAIFRPVCYVSFREGISHAKWLEIQAPCYVIGDVTLDYSLKNREQRIIIGHPIRQSEKKKLTRKFFLHKLHTFFLAHQNPQRKGKKVRPWPPAAPWFLVSPRKKKPLGVAWRFSQWRWVADFKLPVDGDWWLTNKSCRKTVLISGCDRIPRSTQEYT